MVEDNVLQKPRILSGFSSLMIEVTVSDNLANKADLVRMLHPKTKELYDKYEISISLVGYRKDGLIHPEPSLRVNSVPNGTVLIYLIVSEKDSTGAVLKNFTEKLIENMQK